ncbi:exostosin-like 2 [Entelurus aequoreus]|uniref:exostosin-like 2 n=1 Tax=Entelurus aequoreus TaxID=161455 RepID=UPI002B1E2E3E|nr:exostosin-like 2 [Entelurus aequoreus]
MRVRGCCKWTKPAYLVWPILLLLMLGAALTALLPSAEDHAGRGVLQVLRRATSESQTYVQGVQGEEQQKFTVIIQTYNRTDILLKLLNHYQALPHLQRIIIVWNNMGEKPPLELWDSLAPHPVPVLFKQQTSNRMHNRLHPFPEIDTDAVLVLDDDTLLSVPDISFAFTVWKQFPEQIVGCVPRRHVASASGVYSYGGFELQDPESAGGDKYSMVLISASFFHRRYLHMFQEQPAAVHALVDATRNCDDIAMNFVVSMHLRKLSGASRPSGVFVKPVDMRNLEKDASSGFQGLWHRPEHLLQRSYCLNRLAHIYGVMPLHFSNLMVAQFGFPSYANHKSRC